MKRHFVFSRQVSSSHHRICYFNLLYR